MFQWDDFSYPSEASIEFLKVLLPKNVNDNFLTLFGITILVYKGRAGIPIFRSANSTLFTFKSLVILL